MEEEHKHISIRSLTSLTREYITHLLLTHTPTPLAMKIPESECPDA
jgi:hypothetical protein